jgi:phosphate acyltransferase
LTAVIRIALDAMGGDFGPSVVLPAALQVLNANPSLELTLVGDQDVIRQRLQELHTAESPRLIIHHASQQVEMNESPAAALKHKKDSSMRVAIDLVKEGKAQACVSAGNTGALMAIARFVLKMLPGVDRPAIIASIPTTGKKTIRMLDLGANVDSKPEHLLQFAIMGSVLVTAVENIERPALGLLNIGHEDIKGNELVKQTARLLQNNRAVNYIGYIEADEVFKGAVDIVVCDGFVGNVALKAGEGAVRLVTHLLKEAFQQNFLTRLAGLCAMPVLKMLRKQMDPAHYNGASLLGLQGIVVKSHGGTSIFGFARAIEEAILEVQQNVPLRIRDEVVKLLTFSESSSL